MVIDSKKYERVKGVLNSIHCREDVICIPEDVTEIGSSAFDRCGYIERIVMNRGLKRIHKRAFDRCRCLKRVDVPDIAAWCAVQRDDADATPFCNFQKGDIYVDNKPLTELILTADIKTVGDYAFRGCHSLRSVTVESDATDIGYEAFGDCENLEKFDMPGLRSWFGAETLCRGPMDEYGLWELLADGNPVTELTVPERVTHIPAHIFYGCKSLTRVALHPGVKSIGAGALGHCPNITRVDISDPIGWYGVNGGNEFAFPESNPDAVVYCNGERYDFNRVPDGVGYVGSYRFARLSVKSDISLPDSVMGIGDGAFRELSGQRKIAVPPLVTDVGRLVFSGSGLAEVKLCEGVRSIGAGAFEKCEHIRFFSVPDSVTEIGDGAFSKCVSLLSVGFGENSRLRKIGERAFFKCAVLSAAELPDGVEKIGRSAFADCKKLSFFTVPDHLSFLDASGLSGCRSLCTLNISLRRFGALSRDLKLGINDKLIVYALRGFAVRYCRGDLKRRELIEWTPFIEYAAGRFICSEIEDPNICRLFTDKGMISAERAELLLESVKNVEARSLLLRHVYRERGESGADTAFSELELDLGLDGGIGETVNLFAEEEERKRREEADKTVELQPVKPANGLWGFFKRLFRNRFQSKRAARREIASENFVIGIEGGVATLEKYTGDSAEVTVPRFFGRTPLLRIGEGAFRDNANVVKVTLPEGVVSIGEHAFDGCGQLTDIVLPSTLTELGEGVFHGCEALCGISPIPAGVGVIPVGAFSGCGQLSQVDIGEGVSVISEYAFCNCTAIRRFNSVRAEKVKDFAFYGCDGLEVFTASEFLGFISDTAFIGREKKLFIETGEKQYAAYYAKKMGIDNGFRYREQSGSIFWWL
ncbi:MAG: leucine-rich repeat domain-containing protein [Clostridia bacterium]|nr:leucine-rich repeat domain-containing protein [Clostridia bacterium]